MNKYENRYWQIEEYENCTVGKLYFTQYYDSEIILSWQRNNNNPDVFNYTSKLLNVEIDEIIADDIKDAMEQFEDMIIEHINDEISVLEDFLRKFNEQ